ncbi:RING-type E3 ubiquitin transferase [Sarracenia purpurea var. burkii]
MVKFSVEGEDDLEGPSSPRPKKQRTVLILPEHEQQNRTDERPQAEDYDEAADPDYDEEADSDYDEEEEEGESEYDQETEEQEEEVNNWEELDGTSGGQPSIGGPCNVNRGSVGPSEHGLTLTLTDPDVLDCPICLEPLISPVFQYLILWLMNLSGIVEEANAFPNVKDIISIVRVCENGHVSCSSCCTKLGNKCPSCSWPIGYNRCRAIERVIESAKVVCRNTKYGCKEIVSYNKHLSLHFTSTHSNIAKRFRYNTIVLINLDKHQASLILQELNEGEIFILNNGIVLLGNVMSVSCIGPSSSKKGFSYNLIARNGGSSVRLQSFTENIPGRVDHSPPLKRFLLVPRDFVGSCGKLKLELSIWKNPRVPSSI